MFNYQNKFSCFFNWADLLQLKLFRAIMGIEQNIAHLTAFILKTLIL